MQKVFRTNVWAKIEEIKNFGFEDKNMSERLDRINELAAKAKKEGLTPAEKEEQARLRQEYLAQFRANFRGILDNTSIHRPDGSVESLKRKDSDTK